MVADFGLDARRLRAPLYHPVNVLLPHRRRAAGAFGLVPGCAEQRPVRVVLDASGGQVRVQELLEDVVARHLVLLAAFLMEAHPAAPALREVVLDLHADDRVHAGEGVDHDADKRVVAELGDGGLLCFRAVRLPDLRDDAVQQRPRLLGGEHRRLALRHHVAQAAHGVGRVRLDDVAGHQPVKQHPQRG